ncbi:MAG: LamG domain-containing protein [Cyclobacteriaceae bacterium]|nr:LamG domain-containing protein [Cyclobacteriaceae bacterium]
MKSLTLNRIAGIALIGIMGACNDGIDPITAVAPGPDETAPVINVTYPAEGTEIKVAEVLTSINIKFEVTDDIEIKSINVKMDGTDVATFNEFLDYRRSVKDILYEGLSTGEHVLTIVATDIDNKVTTKNVNFEKTPPYTPVFAGEVFYMPFDGINTELISITNPTVVGIPSFAGEGKKGGNAYKGAGNAYLTFPATNLTKTNEFSASFWMKVNDAPNRAGVLVINSPDPNSTNPADPNLTKGFRFFRETGDGGKQRFKLNVGRGTANSWFDGGINADVAANTGEWVHFAFSISATNAAVYINGQVASQGALPGPIDWTGCDLLSIMSGEPRFTQWNHKSDESQMDELRLFDKALTQAEVLAIIDSDYTPKYAGEVFYMPFDADYGDLVGGSNATVVGSPSLQTGKVGKAYAGAADSYLTYPLSNLGLGNAFSISFWYKANITPDRAGVITVGPPGINTRTSGFRLFRENGANTFKSNLGIGTGDSWNDGGAISATDWVFVTMVAGGGSHGIYVNGTLLRAESTYTGGISWADCETISIGSGAPVFTEWGHLSDNSLIDEIRIFNRKLSEAEIQEMMND